MIVQMISFILFLVFTVLSGFHFYWFFGGVWGLKKVIPAVANEEQPLAIPQIATLVVALGLLSFGILYLNNTALIHINFPVWLTQSAFWIIPSVFALRAIGEFKYVGFFKKVKDTEFAIADSKVFSPLCLSIFITGMLILFL